MREKREAREERRFLHRLALGIGGHSIASIKQTFAAREVDEWRNHYREEPWGAWRDNAHAALIVACLSNIYRKKGKRPIDWRRFIFMTKGERRSSDLKQAIDTLTSVATPGGRRGRKKLTREQKRDRSGKAGRKA